MFSTFKIFIMDAFSPKHSIFSVCGDYLLYFDFVLYMLLGKNASSCLENDAIYECNQCCSCPESCRNRVTQKETCHRLLVLKTQRKGHGLFTENFITKGSFVTEYVGEIITFLEAKERLSRSSNRSSYVFTLREHYGKSVLYTFVDAEKKGNAARYINHSCDPNLTVVPVRVDSVVPRLCLFAIRNIQAGEELSFMYGNGNEINSNMSRKCFCSSEKCKGVLPFDENLLKCL